MEDMQFELIWPLGIVSFYFGWILAGGRRLRIAFTALMILAVPAILYAASAWLLLMLAGVLCLVRIGSPVFRLCGLLIFSALNYLMLGFICYSHGLLTKADMMTLAHALEEWKEANGRYPRHTFSAPFVLGAPAGGLPGFSARLEDGVLTTPVLFIKQYLPDSLSPTEHPASFAYYAPEGRTWLLLSPGPDLQYDITPDRLTRIGPDDDAEEMQHKLAPYLYDPTNGSLSRGDYLRGKD